jgi:uroporphyrinogen-III decarboxylase
MSQEQFDTFYWPSLKKVMDALIEEGLIQRLFAEGGFNTRLEAVDQFPKGFVTWYFDRSDMGLVKKVLGDKCCIQGNVPISMIVGGTPPEVKEYCRDLIETCGKGGGFILAAGTAGSHAKIDNLRAMMEAVREYGVYRQL